MRIATMIIGLVLMVVVFLQACTITALEDAAGTDPEEAVGHGAGS